MGFGVPNIRGTFLGGTCNKDYNNLVSILLCVGLKAVRFEDKAVSYHQTKMEPPKQSRGLAGVLQKRLHGTVDGGKLALPQVLKS